MSPGVGCDSTAQGNKVITTLYINTELSVACMNNRITIILYGFSWALLLFGYVAWYTVLISITIEGLTFYS